jgi:hypothetical protein
MRTLVLVLATISVAAAQDNKWKPYKFQGNEQYEYKIVTHEGDTAAEVVYILDIKSTGKKSEDGEELFDVAWTTKSKMKKSELGEKTAFGAMGGWGVTPSIIVMNPMCAALFEQLEMKEGEKTNFFGMGTAKVTGKVKVAERDGFVCEFWTKKEEKESKDFEWVIDPALALPLKSTTYEDGKIKYQMELLSYKKY